MTINGVVITIPVELLIFVGLVILVISWAILKALGGFIAWKLRFMRPAPTAVNKDDCVQTRDGRIWWVDANYDPTCIMLRSEYWSACYIVDSAPIQDLRLV